MLFLKSEEAVKVTVLNDLDKIFRLIKDNETKYTEVTGNDFHYSIIFYGISQYKHCFNKME